MSRKKTSTIKRGSLSESEKKNIRDWLEFKTDEEIARDLRRAIDQVQKYKTAFLASAPQLTVKRTEAEEYRRELRGKVEYLELTNQFTDPELAYFENQYIAYRRELKDLTAPEFTQLKHLITLDVFMNRHNSERMSTQKEIERLQRLLDAEYKKSEEDREIEITMRLEENLAANKAASTQRTKEYKDLLDKHQAIMRDLKQTREQRVKNIDQKGRFIEILKMLTDQDTRRIIDDEIGVYDLGVKKERERLSKQHTYMDNTVDPPILTSETING